MAPTTPKKRKTPIDDTSDDASSKKPYTPSKKAASTKIPNNEDELSAEDRMMLRMKEEGHSWKEITAAWTSMTGKTPVSLHVRYRRLKSALARISEEHIDDLVTIKEKVDQEIETEKLALEKQCWSRVTTQLEAHIGIKYDQATVERAWRKRQTEQSKDIS